MHDLLEARQHHHFSQRSYEYAAVSKHVLHLA